MSPRLLFCLRIELSSAIISGAVTELNTLLPFY